MAVNGLTARQRLGIDALLNNPIITKASKACGIPTRSLTRWLAMPEFQEALEVERKRLNNEAFSNLKSALSGSVDVLRELLKSDNEGIRLKAALSVIQLNLEVVEMESLERRIETLESDEDGDYEEETRFD